MHASCFGAWEIGAAITTKRQRAKKMAAFIKAMQAGTSVNGITKLFTNLSLTSSVIAPAKHAFLRRFVSHSSRAVTLLSCVTSFDSPVSHPWSNLHSWFKRILKVFSSCNNHSILPTYKLSVDWIFTWGLQSLSFTWRWNVMKSLLTVNRILILC